VAKARVDFAALTARLESRALSKPRFLNPPLFQKKRPFSSPRFFKVASFQKPRFFKDKVKP
jgi:hypothetical protein